jgi:sporulation protein YlmC with PRC-barrel domain
MRTIPIAAVAALALMAGVASAQTSSTTTPNVPARPAPGATTAPAPAPRAPAINPLAQEDVSKIDGTAVYGGDDGKVGHVSTMLMDPASKKIDRLVVTSGGILGVGGHRVAIPIDKFSWDADRGVFKLGMTEASLKQMPEWVEGQETATGSSLPSQSKALTPSTSTTTPSTGAGDSSR